MLVFVEGVRLRGEVCRFWARFDWWCSATRRSAAVFSSSHVRRAHRVASHSMLGASKRLCSLVWIGSAVPMVSTPLLLQDGLTMAVPEGFGSASCSTAVEAGM